MVNGPGLLKTGLVIAGFFAIRILARLRVDRRKRVEVTTPLVDPILLETTFAAHPGDDKNTLEEVRDTLAHLNRRLYAEEFWNVDAQLAKFDNRLPKAARKTLRRAVLRMLDTDDRWLQIVGAKTSARLNIVDAKARLTVLANSADTSAPELANDRFRSEIAASLDKLSS